MHLHDLAAVTRTSTVSVQLHKEKAGHAVVLRADAKLSTSTAALTCLEIMSLLSCAGVHMPDELDKAVVKVICFTA